MTDTVTAKGGLRLAQPPTRCITLKSEKVRAGPPCTTAVLLHRKTRAKQGGRATHRQPQRTRMMVTKRACGAAALMRAGAAALINVCGLPSYKARLFDVSPRKSPSTVAFQPFM